MNKENVCEVCEIDEQGKEKLRSSKDELSSLTGMVRIWSELAGKSTGDWVMNLLSKGHFMYS